MRVLIAISGNTLSIEIRKEFQTEDIVKWIRARRRLCREHVSRMSNNRLAKVARDGRPASNRPPGRPSRRWKDSP